MKQLTKITLHGKLGEAVGKTWNLAVSSVAEAMRAIQVLSNRKLFSCLQEFDKNNIKYKVLINKRPFVSDKPLVPEDRETILNSELTIRIARLISIDVVPIIEGAGGDGASIGTIFLGVVLIIIGIALLETGPIGGALIMAGIGLIAGGVTNLLASPPKNEDFRAIQGGGRVSYLFNGPENVIGEGGPVPVGYGRLIIGSQVVSASYEISHRNADDNALTV